MSHNDNMCRRFIPELHDIGKLVLVSDDIRTKLNIEGHTFVNFKFNEYGIQKPSSPSWWGQYHHKIKNSEDINDWEKYNIPIKFRRCLFLLKIADHLASSISRAVEENVRSHSSTYEGLYKLWNKEFYKNEKTKENIGQPS